jgi:hypothetical protein
MSQNDTLSLPSGTGTPCPVCGKPIPAPPRYALVLGNQDVIRDHATGRNLFFLAESGFGPSSSVLDLAARVVDYLNSHEAEPPSV